MIDAFSFMIGVLCGQASFAIGYILAIISKPLLNIKLRRKEKEGGCPSCHSSKIAETETPGRFWCEDCGNEYGTSNKGNSKESNATERVRPSFDDDGLGLGEIRGTPRVKGKAKPNPNRSV